MRVLLVGEAGRALLDSALIHDPTVSQIHIFGFEPPAGIPRGLTVHRVRPPDADFDQVFDDTKAAFREIVPVTNHPAPMGVEVDFIPGKATVTNPEPVAAEPAPKKRGRPKKAV